MSAALPLSDGLLQALALLPPDTAVTVTVAAGALVRALEIRAGGPEVLSSKQAATLLGYSADQWKRWAAEGAIAGAWQDSPGAPWHLPRAACEAHIGRLQQRGRKAHPPQAAQASTTGARSTSRSPRSGARGPRASHVPSPSEVGARAERPQLVALPRQATHPNLRRGRAPRAEDSRPATGTVTPAGAPAE